MNASPLVSVLMPVYNGERYIGKAICSLLGQTYANLQIIIINDGSTDKTVEVIRGFTDPRLHVIFHSENQGIAKSRNDAIDYSSGKYIAWLDADDIAHPERIANQVQIMEERPDIGFCCTNVESIDADGAIVSKPWWTPSKVPIEWQLLWNNPVAQSSVMIRRDILIKNELRYEQLFVPSEDYRMWCRLSLITQMKRLGRVLLSYRVLSSGAYIRNFQHAMRSSVLASRDLAGALTGRSVPDIHQFLTRFRHEKIYDQWSVKRSIVALDWLQVLERSLRSRVSWPFDESLSIRINIVSLLVRAIRKYSKTQWWLLGGTFIFLGFKYPVACLVFLSGRICRHLRSIACIR